jgi:hypothetical protein
LHLLINNDKLHCDGAASTKQNGNTFFVAFKKHLLHARCYFLTDKHFNKYYYFISTQMQRPLIKMYMYGMVWYGMVWYGMVWYGMVWYGMVWYVVWYGMVWYGMICMVW